MNRLHLYFAAASAVAMALPSGAQSTWSDDFNRPNSTSALGPNWAFHNGAMGISSNRGYGLVNDHSIAFNLLASANYASVTTSIDFFAPPTPSLCYVGLCIGLQSSWECVFLKV